MENIYSHGCFSNISSLSFIFGGMMHKLIRTRVCQSGPSLKQLFCTIRSEETEQRLRQIIIITASRSRWLQSEKWNECSRTSQPMLLLLLGRIHVTSSIDVATAIDDPWLNHIRRRHRQRYCSISIRLIWRSDISCSLFACSLTGRFAILKPQNPSISEFNVVQERLFCDTKSVKRSVGSQQDLNRPCK